MNNKTVKRLVLLRDRSKARREAQSFVIEGVRAVADADPAFIEEVYITEELLGQDAAGSQRGRDLRTLLSHVQNVPMTMVTAEVMRKISDTETPQGVLAVVRMPEHSLEELLSANAAPLFLVCEDVQDPGNMGTMIRTAEAAGVTAVILSKGCVDPYNPKTVRATMSAIFREPIVVVEDLHAAIHTLQQHAVRVYAADLAGAVDYDTCDYTIAAAFMIGNEGNGLRQETSDLADTKIKIPMQGQIESLNAAMSAGILMYEATRQRR